MWKWFSRRPTPPASQSSDDIRRKLAAAHQIVQAHNEKWAQKEAAERLASFQEILPSSDPDAVIGYEPPPPLAGNSAQAAALESILQGKRVEPQIFTDLFRAGFVSKDAQGQWTITATGKTLIERHKLITPIGVYVAGVKCGGSWG